MPVSALARRRRVLALAPVALAATGMVSGLFAAAGGTAGASAPVRRSHPAPLARRSHPAPPAAVTGPTAAALSASSSHLRMGADATSAAWLTIEGHGDGHGRGMGQWGAFGYASEAAYHWSDTQILAHYYGGATLEPLAPGIASAPVKVNLSELDAATATVVRATRAGSSLTVNGAAPRSGTVTVAHDGATQTIRSTAGDVSVQLPGIGWRAFRGYLQVQPDGQTWNIVGLQSYVEGVVPAESVAAWGEMGGEAALEAQAVASRSYGLAYIADVGFTCDTPACQDYLGDPGRNAALEGMQVYSNQAVVATAGQVLCTVAGTSCPASDIAFAEYSASTGGWSAGGAFPAVVDRGDAVNANPIHDWSVPVTRATVAALWPGVGRPTGVSVTARNGYGQWGGRAATVVVTGQNGSVTMTGDEFAADLGLWSDWFTVAGSAPLPTAPPVPVSPPTTVPVTTAPTVPSP